MSVWDKRKEILDGNGLVAKAVKTTPLKSTRSMAQSAITVERDLINYLFNMIVLVAVSFRKLPQLCYMYLQSDKEEHY